MDQIEWTDSIIAKARAGKFHNPPGLYVATIRDNVAPPATFLSSRKRRLQEEARQAKNVELAQHAQHELAYAEYQSEAIETYIAELPEREYQQMLLEGSVAPGMGPVKGSGLPLNRLASFRPPSGTSRVLWHLAIGASEG